MLVASEAHVGYTCGGGRMATGVHPNMSRRKSFCWASPWQNSSLVYVLESLTQQSQTNAKYQPRHLSPSISCMRVSSTCGWVYSVLLKSIGFAQGQACPCLCLHKARGFAISVHGDEFTTCWPKCEIDWFLTIARSKV